MYLNAMNPSPQTQTHFNPNTATQPLPTVYEPHKNIIWVPDQLTKTELDGMDGRYDGKMDGAKIKVLKKKKGVVKYPGNPASYGYPQHTNPKDPYSVARVPQGGTVFDPQKNRILVPDAATKTQLDAQDGMMDGTYHGHKLRVKKPKKGTYPVNTPGTAPYSSYMGQGVPPAASMYGGSPGLTYGAPGYTMLGQSPGYGPPLGGYGGPVGHHYGQTYPGSPLSGFGAPQYAYQSTPGLYGGPGLHGAPMANTAPYYGPSLTGYGA